MPTKKPPAKKSTTVAKRTPVTKTQRTSPPARRSGANSTVTRSGSARTRVTKAPKGTVGPKYTEIGASGLQVVGGRVNEEFLPLLRGERGIRMWREMGDNDAYSGALLYGVMQTILRAEWTVDLNEASVKEGDFLEQSKDDMEHPFRDVVAEAMTMGQFGWALLEVVYKMRRGPDVEVPSDFTDGRFGWRSMGLRAQETLYQWIVDPQIGRIVGMRQRLWGTELDIGRDAYVDIPFERCLLFRTTHHKDNPEGRSLLRNGWSSYDKRKNIEIFEGIGIERNLAGIPVFKIPAENLSPSATQPQKDAVAEFHRIGKNLRVDDQTHIVMPNEFDEHGNPLYEFELASVGGRVPVDTNTVILRLAVAQLMSIMADVMMVGHEDQGSRALANTKEQMFTSGCQSLLDEVRGIINDNAVARLFRMNGVAPPWPKFSTSPIERTDPAEFVKNVLTLAQSGMPLWPDDDLDGYIRDFLGWPAQSNPGLGMRIQPTPTITTEPKVKTDGPVTDAPTTIDAGTKEDPPPPKRGTGANPSKQVETQGATKPRVKRPVKVGD